jgi:membrane-bound lytic murein transglycosylase D
VFLSAQQSDISAETSNLFTADFSRPLRSKPDLQAGAAVNSVDIRAAGNSAAKDTYPKSPLLTQAALEKPLTRHYIRQYSGSGGLSWLTAVMKRGGPYLAFIRREIADRNLPEELLYIPVIESGYLSTALSRSGAAGLWQFMKNSIAPFDMKVNDWIDERRDFWKSTQGALRKLEENYKYFGDWPLALAAYNAGLGAVNRVIQQSGIRDYWLLSEKNLLKTETIHYVPKLIAASYILSNPRQFGMEQLWPEDPEWTRINVTQPADIRILAREAGIDRDELIWANRELLYNVTPAGNNYYLKVRGKDAEKTAAILSKNDLALINYYMHTIRSGDTLLALALHYGITVEQIMASNPGIQERYLRIGNRLLIPALKETGPYERPAPPRENLVFGGSHLVKKGETLWSIALGYDVDPEVLAEANGMELTDVLREGKTIKTPIK